MKKISIVSAILLAGIIFMSCACRTPQASATKASSNDTSDLLTDVQWNLVNLNGTPFTTDDNFYIIFNSDENRANGKGDCNLFSGNYTLKGDGKIEMGAMASTRMFCPQQQKEDQFFQILDKIDSFKVVGDRLMLFDDGLEIAILEKK